MNIYGGYFFMKFKALVLFIIGFHHCLLNMERISTSPLLATDQEIEEWINSLSSAIPPLPITPELVLEPIINEPTPEQASIDSLINFFEQNDHDDQENEAPPKKIIRPSALTPLQRIIKAIRTSDYCDARTDIQECREAINQKTHLSLCHLLRPDNCENQHRFKQEVTPLIFACYQKKREIVSILLEKGADPNIRGHDDITPLLVASANQQYEIVKDLLNFGADYSVASLQGNSPLRLAFIKNDRILISLFTPRGRSKLEQPAKMLAYPSQFTHYWAEQKWLEKLFAAISDSRHIYTVFELTKPEKRGDLNALFLKQVPSILFEGETQRMITALHFACYQDNLDALRILLAQGAEPNVVEFYGVTPLMIGAARGKSEIVTTLLQNSAKKHYQETYTNQCAAEIAEKKGHQTVKKIIMYFPEN